MMRFKRWTSDDIAEAAIGTTMILAAQIVVMSSFVKWSTVIAGCLAAVVLKHLEVAGYTFLSGTWLVRFGLTAALITALAVGAVIASLLGIA